MNLPSNPNVLHQELLRFLYFLQTLTPMQIRTLWQYVQFEDKDQKWSSSQLIQLFETANPQQIDQLVCVTTSRIDDDESANDKQEQLASLSSQLACPVSQLEAVGPLYQMFQLQDLVTSFSFVQLMKFFEVIPAGSQMLNLLQQLQQLFGQLTPEALTSLHQEITDVTPEMEMQQLSHSLHLPPDHFHLYQPMRALLHMELGELLSLQDILPKLQPIQMLQLLQLLQLQPYDVIEIKNMFPTTSSSHHMMMGDDSSGARSPYQQDYDGDDMMDIPDNRDIIPSSSHYHHPPVPSSQSQSSSSSSATGTRTQTLTLQIIDQPPEKAVYKRNIRPNPSVQLVGESLGPLEGELVVFPILVRCDTFAEENKFLTGAKPVPITSGKVVPFKKLKVQVTSHQQETLFSIRFELRRVQTDNSYEILNSVSTNPICILSHSTQLKPAPVLAPVVTEVIPGSGPCSGGTRVAILGANFADTPATRVKFDNVDVIPEFRGPGTLVCHTPAHLPGQVLVRVCNGGSSWSDTASTFIYEGLPSHSAIRTTTTVQYGSHDPLSPSNLDLSLSSSGLNSLDYMGYAPIHYASSGGNLQHMMSILNHGGDPNLVDKHGNTGLHWAVAFAHYSIIKLLVQFTTRLQLNRSIANIPNNEGTTPLHWACAKGDLVATRMLVEGAGGIVNGQDLEGASPLHAAVCSSNPDLVKYMISRGAYICGEDDCGDTPLHYAVREGHVATAAALIESLSQSIPYQPSFTTLPATTSASMCSLFTSQNGITLLPPHAQPNEDGETPLHIAACTGNYHMVALLLQHSAPLGIRDATGWTAVHHAASAGYDMVIRVMADSCVQLQGEAIKAVHAADADGNTALHMACEKGFQEIACRLLLLGADPFLKNRNGKTPIQLAPTTLKLDRLPLPPSPPLHSSSSSSSYMPSSIPRAASPHSVYVQQLIDTHNNHKSPFIRNVTDWLHKATKSNEDLQQEVTLITG
eukprot:TRINITY_DN5883_c0_g1_i1.p1 TRINITY_DN5883_c0_g1~~TRINITY_DN5883_c0_g1_i1.p1  ORF type:complete len:1054 (-),score=281.45 TRINITY_DN5883_c0_g1_i1:378-3302(-)